MGLSVITCAQNSIGFSIGYNIPTGGFGAPVTKDIVHQDLYGSANAGMGITILYRYQLKNKLTLGVITSLNHFEAQTFKFSDHFAFMNAPDITGKFWVIPLVLSLEYHLTYKRFEPYAGVQLGTVYTRCNYTVDQLYSSKGIPTEYIASELGLVGGFVLGCAIKKSDKTSFYISNSFLKGTNKHLFDKNAKDFNTGFKASEFIAFNIGLIQHLK